MRQEFAPRTLATTVRYAGTSGDLNPLHYDPRAAARAGFDNVIVHGAYMAAYLEHTVRAQLGGEVASEYAVRFVRPVKVGEGLFIELSRQVDGMEAHLEGAAGSEDRRVSATLRTGSYSAPSARPDDFIALSVPYSWPVEHGALRSFLQATTDAAVMPSQEAIVPLCFIANAARWTPSQESIVKRLGFAYDRMLHGETIIQVYGEPLRVGDRYSVIEAHGNRSERPHRSGGTMRFGDAIHEITDESGAVRARVINRMLERPARPSS